MALTPGSNEVVTVVMAVRISVEVQFSCSQTTVSNKRKRENLAAEAPRPEVTYKKVVDKAFRKFLTEKEVCLWKLVDEYYGNPLREGESNNS